MQLYKTANDIAELIDALDEDMAADDLPQWYMDTIDALSLELTEKIEKCAMVLRSYQGQIDVLKAEEARLAARRKSRERKMQGLKDYMQQAMETVDTDKIKTELFTVSIQSNPPAVIVDDVDAVPCEYLIPQESKVDKKAMVNALKAGAVIPGAHLEQTRSLRVR